MGRRLLALIFVCIMIVTMCSCGTSNKDTESESVKYGMVKLPDGTVVSGEVQDTQYYSNDAVKITINDMTYLTSDVNVCTWVNK